MDPPLSSRFDPQSTILSMASFRGITVKGTLPTARRGTATSSITTTLFVRFKAATGFRVSQAFDSRRGRYHTAGVEDTLRFGCYRPKIVG
jgi:hypothetical protein